MGYTPMRQAYHGNEDGKGGDDLGPEPVGGLDVFNPLQNTVLKEKLFLFSLVFAVVNVLLDPLFKLRPGSLLQHTGYTSVNLTHARILRLYIHTNSQLVYTRNCIYT